MRPIWYAKNTDCLGRYYTPAYVSDILIQSIDDMEPRALVDLGAGEGSLSLAASKRWVQTELATVDVDHGATKNLSRLLANQGFKGHHHHVADDALSISMPDVLASRMRNTPMVAVCNPPFLIPRWRKSYGEIAEAAGLSSCLPPPNNTDAALLFLAQNLRVINSSGTIAIIVPDSLASAGKYSNFRRWLVRHYDVKQAIRLPRSSFSGTEAQAHIFIIRKQPPASDQITLSILNEQSGILQSMTVDREQASARLDINFHKQKLRPAKLVLGDVALDVRRGALNSAEIRASSQMVLHTTDITSDMHGCWVHLKTMKSPSVSEVRYTMAMPGDVLVARVGRNASEKVIGIKSGCMPISDCLFRIRVPTKYRESVMRAISSTAGRRWLEAQSHGVAARHISKGDLLKLPLDLK